MSVATQTLSPPSRTLMLIEGRALSELGAFAGALAAAESRAARRRTLGAGLPRSDRQRHFHASAARVSQAAAAMTRSGWGQGRNFGPRAGVERRMLDHIRELRQRSGRKVSLIGWSLGGVYARQLAKLVPDDVRQVITLGSPFTAARAPPTRGGSMNSPADAVPTRRRPCGSALHATPPVPTTAIFSRTDGVCAWQCCVEKEGPQAENIEVAGQPLRPRPSPRRRLRHRGSPGAARGRVEAVRSHRLAQPGLSEPPSVASSRPVSAHGSRRAALPRSSP